jgi:cytochrome P450
MMHNPDVFDKPFEFIPERYLKDGRIDPSVTDTEAAAFGHGRRYALRKLGFEPILTGFLS